jgi:hypothetical protein
MALMTFKRFRRVSEIEPLQAIGATARCGSELSEETQLGESGQGLSLTGTGAELSAKPLLPNPLTANPAIIPKNILNLFIKTI